MKYISLIIACLFICFLIGIKYERDKGVGLITVYTPIDIIFADLNSLKVDFEVSDEVHEFNTRQDMLDFVEQRSADNSQGMKEYQVQLDFDTVSVYQYGRYVDCYVIGETLNQFDEITSL